jgi:hypothetical protein
LILSQLAVLEERMEGKRGNSNFQVSATMLLKTHGGKMSLFGLATILMKTKDIHKTCHDVSDNRGA